jgi:hypothetical protein
VLTHQPRVNPAIQPRRSSTSSYINLLFSTQHHPLPPSLSPLSHNPLILFTSSVPPSYLAPKEKMNASCQCGAISFKTPLPKPLAVYICHCDECRRQSSSAFGCSAIFPAFPLPANVKGALSVYS